MDVVIQARHLKGSAAICEAFSVSHDTLVAWVKKGAPVAIVGRKYQADYHVLLAWLVKHSGGEFVEEKG